MASKTPNFRGTFCCSDQLCRMSNRTNDGVRNLNALGNLSSINLTRRNQSVPLSSHYLNPAGSNNQFSSMPPPLPPRHDPIYSPRYGGLSGFGSYHSPFSRYSPGLYSGYGGYHQYPYSRYGAIDNSSNSFIQLAEESTRPAFESVESLVEVVSSISMMLESCYFAVHSSYSAILGVVDQFSRLKDRLAEVLSMLALLRTLRWLCLKILYILKLRKDNPSVDAAWQSATKAVSNSSPFTEDTNKSAWPFLFFIGLVIGAPWLMFKLLSKSITKKSFDPSTWVKDGKLAFAVTAYDFAATRPGELSFSAGEKLYLAPKGFRTSIPRGWLLACNKNKETGLIPANYLASFSSNGNHSSFAANTFTARNLSVTEDETFSKWLSENHEQSPQSPIFSGNAKQFSVTSENPSKPFDEATSSEDKKCSE